MTRQEALQINLDNLNGDEVIAKDLFIMGLKDYELYVPETHDNMTLSQLYENYFESLHNLAIDPETAKV